MLIYVKITNFALIEESELEFGSGFNVVTGESGAGKSILMGAVELLLGGRVDKGVIRNGCDRCPWCAADLPCRRGWPVRSARFSFRPEFRSIRRSRCSCGGCRASSVRNYVNDTPVSARLLASVGEQLIDLHGANEQLSLTVPARQLDLLDRYAGAEEAAALCGRIAGELEALAKEREEFDRQTPGRGRAGAVSSFSSKTSTRSTRRRARMKSFRLGSRWRGIRGRCLKRPGS